MTFKKILSLGILLLLSLSFFGVTPIVLAASSASDVPMKAPPLEEGKEYITLPYTVSSQPPVVEFFSFYCGPCYQFINEYPVSDAINRALSEGKVTKYHVSLMGVLGNELTEAWAIAIVLEKTELLERPLFEAVRDGKLKGIEDIKSIFSQFGIETEIYKKMQQTPSVKNTITIQNAAIKKFKVKGTPSFYINGKYQINNSGIAATSSQTYVDNFAKAVKILLSQ
ncbi:DsbA family protein [Serratia sp. (in: enterobacteria)]|uniref:DsbA family protein n=1 Tax=Serratia sp. (in: enterobacteria) TaxID=616 RepID=UPI003988FB22